MCNIMISVPVQLCNVQGSWDNKLQQNKKQSGRTLSSKENRYTTPSVILVQHKMYIFIEVDQFSNILIYPVEEY